ncbi:MAG: hypothetical protein CHACPFDD_01227 [Phycisphaerae bacterium]|nr:hypothetical protein [Phycisphaerae bacterium]
MAVRGFWLAMLLAHGPAVLAAWVALFDAGTFVDALPRVVGLSFSAAFFVLKLCDVAWLRFNADLRSIAVLALAVLLIHVGLIERTAGIDADAAFATTLRFVSWLGSAALLCQIAQRCANRPDRVRRPVVASRFFRWREILVALLPQSMTRLRDTLALRAPPFLINGA